jgi:hypothetical protein
MIDEPRNNAPTPAFKQSGIGMEARRLCMGCHQSKSILCSAGVGVQWRCIDCLTARRAKAAAKAAEGNNVKEEA